MGFPVGYSDMLLPRVLMQVLLLLGHLHGFLLWAFHAVGLGDLIDLSCSDYYYYYPPTEHHQQPLQQRRPEFRGVPAVQLVRIAIDEALPVVRFAELAAAACGGDCAVCLGGIGAADEVRRLGNCRHAFHVACLDRWIAHDQRTCPLCRAPLVAGEPWWPDAADDHDPSYPSSLPSTPLQPVPTPTLLRPHELLLTGLGGFQ